jgi:hypothetical protein
MYSHLVGVLKSSQKLKLKKRELSPQSRREKLKRRFPNNSKEEKVEDIEERWKRALEKTEIFRARFELLYSHKVTELPYIFLSESLVNVGNTVVRKGKVSVAEPLIIPPPNYPLFEGFEFKEKYNIEPDTLRSFLLMRGVSFPSLKYRNEMYTLDLYEDTLKNAIEHFKEELQRAEDITTGLIVGEDDAWQFSILIYVALLVTKSASQDIKRFLERFKRRDQ